MSDGGLPGPAMTLALLIGLTFTFGVSVKLLVWVLTWLLAIVQGW